jgi:hypothetical protein
VDCLVDPLIGRFEALLERCFDVGPDCKMNDSELEVLLNKARMSNHNKNAFKNWLKKRFKVVRPKKKGETRRRFWDGVGIKKGPDLETSPYSDEFCPSDGSGEM